jgi:hypothetical protein
VMSQAPSALLPAQLAILQVLKDKPRLDKERNETLSAALKSAPPATANSKPAVKSSKPGG